MNNSKEARKEAERQLSEDQAIYYNWFMALLHNSVQFENLPDELPKRYLLKVLFNKGAIAYDKQTKLFLPFCPAGIDIYGLPQKYQLIGYNGYTVWRKPEQVVILRLNDRATPIEPYIYKQSCLLADLDSFLRQNLDSNRTMTIVECESESQRLSLVNEYNARRVGASMVIVNKNALKGTNLTAINTGAQWLVDQCQQVRTEVVNETLQRIGCATANTAKRERVQGAEVIASQGEALDSIYSIIDTFNYDAEVAGLSIRMIPNSSLTVQTNEVRDEFKEGEIIGQKQQKEEVDNGEN